jgi:chromosome segregation ATPase
MGNEEMNRKMEFIVDQQTQFVADINVMREVQEQDGKFLKEHYRKLSDAVITVVGLVGSLTKAQSRADDRINEITQAQAHTDDRINVLVQAQTRTDESFNLLAQAQTRTDESFNLLTQAQTRTDERINLLADSCNLLAQAQTRTDERLNIFINVVERHISGNGGAENPA